MSLADSLKLDLLLLRRQYTVFEYFEDVMDFEDSYDYKILEFSPGIFSLRVFSNHDIAFECRFSIARNCKDFDSVVYYLYRIGLISHDALVLGDCKTMPDFRRRGFYKYGLKLIISGKHNVANGECLISSRDDNFWSRKGIISVGFRPKFSVFRLTISRFDFYKAKPV